MRRVVGAGSPEVLRASSSGGGGGDSSSPCSAAETSFRELDDVFLQTQTRIWLGEVLLIRFDEETAIADLLADGELLFQVSKVVWKMLLKKYADLKHSKVYIYERTSFGKNDARYMPYPKVDSFLKICQILGLTGIDLFSPSDVVEKRDVRRVCMCIRSLSIRARSKNLNVPDFDIVTYTIAMPSDLVDGILRSLEQSQNSSSSTGCNSPWMDYRERYLQKSPTGQHAWHNDSYFESDDAESAFTELEFQSPLSNASHAFKISNIIGDDFPEGHSAENENASEAQHDFQLDSQDKIKVGDTSAREDDDHEFRSGLSSKSTSFHTECQIDQSARSCNTDGEISSGGTSAADGNLSEFRKVLQVDGQVENDAFKFKLFNKSYSFPTNYRIDQGTNSCFTDMGEIVWPVNNPKSHQQSNGVFGSHRQYFGSTGEVPSHELDALPVDGEEDFRSSGPMLWSKSGENNVPPSSDSTVKPYHPKEEFMKTSISCSGPHTVTLGWKEDGVRPECMEEHLNNGDGLGFQDTAQEIIPLDETTTYIEGKNNTNVLELDVSSNNETVLLLGNYTGLQHGTKNLTLHSTEDGNFFVSDTEVPASSCNMSKETDDLDKDGIGCGLKREALDNDIVGAEFYSRANLSSDNKGGNGFSFQQDHSREVEQCKAAFEISAGEHVDSVEEEAMKTELDDIKENGNRNLLISSSNDTIPLSGCYTGLQPGTSNLTLGCTEDGNSLKSDTEIPVCIFSLSKETNDLDNEGIECRLKREAVDNEVVDADLCSTANFSSENKSGNDDCTANGFSFQRAHSQEVEQCRPALAISASEHVKSAEEGMKRESDDMEGIGDNKLFEAEDYSLSVEIDGLGRKTVSGGQLPIAINRTVQDSNTFSDSSKWNNEGSHFIGELEYIESTGYSYSIKDGKQMSLGIREVSPLSIDSGMFSCKDSDFIKNGQVIASQSNLHSDKRNMQCQSANFRSTTVSNECDGNESEYAHSVIISPLHSCIILEGGDCNYDYSGDFEQPSHSFMSETHQDTTAYSLSIGETKIHRSAISEMELKMKRSQQNDVTHHSYIDLEEVKEDDSQILCIEDGSTLDSTSGKDTCMDTSECITCYFPPNGRGGKAMGCMEKLPPQINDNVILGLEIGGMTFHGDLKTDHYNVGNSTGSVNTHIILEAPSSNQASTTVSVCDTVNRMEPDKVVLPDSTPAVYGKESCMEGNVERKGHGVAPPMADYFTKMQHEEGDVTGNWDTDNEECENVVPKIVSSTKAEETVVNGLQKTRNKILQSVAGAMTLVGALLLVHHMRRKRVKEEHGKIFMPHQVHKSIHEISAQRRVEIDNAGAALYPGERLEF